MRRHERGVNLVELIIAIVVVSVAVSGVLLVFSVAVGHSADPMVQQQAVAIAEGYLEEILARPVNDPVDPETGGSEEGSPSLAANRPLLDDVQDYAGLSNQPPQDQNGTELTALAAYAVNVTVTAEAFGPAGDPAPGFRVDVRVTGPPPVDVTLSGYRAVY